MGDDIPFEDMSGAPSPNTIDRPRGGPSSDKLAQGGQWPLLRPRHPVLVAADEEARTRYGGQAALLRDAARMSHVGGMAAHVLGIDDAPRPSMTVQDAGQVMVHGDHNPLSPVRSQDIPPGRQVGRVRDVTDDQATGTPRGDLPPSSRGLGRGRDRS